MTRPNELLNPPPSDYLNGLRGSDQIHRYCSIEELYSIVQGKLTLTCPFAWDDPFENPLFRAKLINRNGIPVPLKEAARRLYCQSWTLEEESDAMWKLFGNEGKGVRITVRSEDLHLKVCNSYDIAKNEAVFTNIGKVCYLEETKLREEFETNDRFYKRFMKLSGEGYYESLLVKREPYSYEKEVRLIAYDLDGSFGCRETMRLEIPISGRGLVEHVTFGPAVDNDTYEAHRERLDKLGLSKEKIDASTLYGELHYTIDLRQT